jgi:hypothetical protein
MFKVRVRVRVSIMVKVPIRVRVRVRDRLYLRYVILNMFQQKMDRASNLQGKG